MSTWIIKLEIRFSTTPTVRPRSSRITRLFTWFSERTTAPTTQGRPNMPMAPTKKAITAMSQWNEGPCFSL